MGNNLLPGIFSHLLRDYLRIDINVAEISRYGHGQAVRRGFDLPARSPALRDEGRGAPFHGAALPFLFKTNAPCPEGTLEP